MNHKNRNVTYLLLLSGLSGGSLGEDGLERHREVQVGLWQFKVDPCRLRGQTLVRVVVEHVLLVVVVLAGLLAPMREGRGRSADVRAPRRLFPAQAGGRSGRH